MSEVSEDVPPLFDDAPPPSDDDAPNAPRGPVSRSPLLAIHGEWTSRLKVDKYGNAKSTYGNLCIVLRHAYGERLTFDEMRATPFLDARPLGDADVGRIREELEGTFALEMSAGNVVDGVRQIAEEHRFHPVRAYLEGLKWDVTVRMKGLAERIFGTSDPLHERMLIAWFVQAARRGIEPGCKADAALVLVGHQGYLKSTFFSILAGEYFGDTRMDISSRDGLMQLAATWIYEWSELENVTSRKQAAEVKAFITSQSDTFRPPFGKAIIRHPRSSVVVGSTNEDQFLNDPTGSRRFWIIPVPARLTDESLEYLRTNRDQLWAEAVVNLRSGYQAYLTLEEEVRREELAEDHQLTDAYDDTIGSWLDTAPAIKLETESNRVERGKSGYITTGDILEHALKIERARWDRATQSRVGVAMKRLGWSHVRKRVSPVRTIWVYVRPDGPAVQKTIGGLPLWQ